MDCILMYGKNRLTQKKMDQESEHGRIPKTIFGIRGNGYTQVIEAVCNVALT